MSLKALALRLSAGFSLPVVTAAHAADIYAPEPEPENPLLACSAFGKGYFYIPGTDTCLKIGGYLSGEIDGGDNIYARTADEYHRKTYTWGSTAQLHISSASVTDYGALRSFFALRSNWWGGAEAGSANEMSKGSLRAGFIQLGGLRVGLDTSAFADWIYYSIGTLNEDIINGSNTRTNKISYTYERGNGFSAIISFEQGNNFDGDGNPQYLSQDGDADPLNAGRDKGGYHYKGGKWHFKKLSQQQHNYTPYIASGVKYEKKWGALAAIAGFDSYYSEWAIKTRGDVNLTPKLAVFAVAAYKSMDDYYNLDKGYGTNGNKKLIKNGREITRRGIYRQINSMYGDWGGHWAFYAGATYAFTPSFKTNWQSAYSTNNTFSAAINLEKQLVPGLIIQPEINYAVFNDNYGRRHKAKDGAEIRPSLKGKRPIQLVLYIKRSF